MPTTVLPWYLPIARAVPALALSAAVTFSADHSAPLGYLTFGLFAVVSGAVVAAFAFRMPERGVSRTIMLVQGAVTVVAGVVALALPAGGLPFFVFLVTTFAAITGFLELYLGLRSRGTDRSSRDWVFVGALTAILAVAVLLVPPGFVQSWVGANGETGQLTASIIIVGALGAYWAIIGVYLVIAGLSLKWATSPEVAAA